MLRICVLHAVFSGINLLLNSKVIATLPDGYCECEYTEATNDTCMASIKKTLNVCTLIKMSLIAVGRIYQILKV